MQAILGREKRNAKITRFFSIFKEAILYKKKKGRDVLFQFLSKIGIAIRKWLIAEGSLEGNSY